MSNDQTSVSITDLLSDQNQNRSSISDTVSENDSRPPSYVSSNDQDTTIVAVTVDHKKLMEKKSLKLIKIR